MWQQEKSQASPFTTGIRKLLCQYHDSCACVCGALPKWLTHSATKRGFLSPFMPLKLPSAAQVDTGYVSKVTKATYIPG